MCRIEREKYPRTWLHVDIAPLHAKHVYPRRKQADQETGGGTPPDDWRADEIVFGLQLAPAAHAQAEPH